MLKKWNENEFLNENATFCDILAKPKSDRLTVWRAVQVVVQNKG